MSKCQKDGLWSAQKLSEKNELMIAATCVWQRILQNLLQILLYNTFENWFFFSFFGCTEKFVHIYGNLVWNRLVLRWYWRLIIEKLELLYVQKRIEYSKIYGNCWFLICFWYLISSRVWSMDENQSSSLSLTYSFFSYNSDSDN